MSIILDNSTNTVGFGADTSLTRDDASSLKTPGKLAADSLSISGVGKGLTFPDTTVQTTAAVIPSVVSAFTNDAGYLTSALPPPVAYNNTFRYQINTTSGQYVNCVSTTTLWNNLLWTRSGTSLTINREAHGHSVGDRMLVKDTNVPFLNSLITSVSTDSYVVTCADSGGTSGSAASYGLGFNLTHAGSAGSITGGTISVPSGINPQDLQLLSLRIHLAANTRTGTSYAFVTPNTIINGLSGGSTSMDDVYLPFQQVRQDGSNLTAVGNTLATAGATNFHTFTFGALPAATTGIQMMMSF